MYEARYMMISYRPNLVGSGIAAASHVANNEKIHTEVAVLDHLLVR